MEALLVLIPVSLMIAGAGLAAFLWSLRSAQYEDLEGAANRILFADDKPLPERRPTATEKNGPDWRVTDTR
jgi:cbb3-type cytochrome oxidase maturation protein